MSAGAQIIPITRPRTVAPGYPRPMTTEEECFCALASRVVPGAEWSCLTATFKAHALTAVFPDGQVNVVWLRQYALPDEIEAAATTMAEAWVLSAGTGGSNGN